MVFKEKEDIITDIAWARLHKKLEQDGLLTEKKGSGNLRNITPFAWAAVITVLLISIFPTLYILRHKDIRQKDLQVIHNEANAPTLATMLSDGSVVFLSEQTSLKYPDAFAENKREVILQGEAFFDVKKNTGQPFFIDTDLAIIEVTGTSFNVKSEEQSSFLLSVRDGEVRVSLKNRQQTVSVKAGETVALHSGQLQLSKTNANGSEGYFKRIHFKDERLYNIAHIINITSDSIRVKVDPEIGNRLLTFTLSGNNDIEAICLALNLQYKKQEQTIYISKRE